MATAIGVRQQTISNSDNSDNVEEYKLREIAKALRLSAEAIKNYSEEGVFNYFNNFYNTSFANSQGTFNSTNCTFNPQDKVVELCKDMFKLRKTK